MSNLASEIRRVEPYSDRFHIDVCDGHYAPVLLFFPDLVRAARPHTKKQFEIHLGCTDPLAWVKPFREAGADGAIFYFDSTREPQKVIDAIRDAGMYVGISLTLDEPIELAQPYIEQLDVLTIMGTAAAIKGAGMDPRVPDKIRAARRIIEMHRSRTEIEADGGIREQTVPVIRDAGADWIVPGSMMFAQPPDRLMRLIASH
jgi:ribulose-phosphate 3-epimerase